MTEIEQGEDKMKMDSSDGVTVVTIGHENVAFEPEQASTSGGTGSSELRAELSGSSSASSSSSSSDNIPMEQEEEETTIEFSSITSGASGLNQSTGSGGHLENNMATAANQLQQEKQQQSKNFQEIELGEMGSPSPSSSSGRHQMNHRARAGDFVINWHNLDYVVESKWWKLAQQRKPILNKLSGCFRSGELSAVLGPSGAGKSTLIDCLLGKHDRGINGRTQIQFADPKLEAERRRRKRPLRIATIPQEDHLLDTLTVAETFMFASRIKNAHKLYADEDEDFGEEEEDDEMKTEGKSQVISKSEQRKRKPFDHFANVQRVIKQLNLSSCASLKCGKLSGGQYKRVSIGQELLSRPDLMILDEPTSGLDSVTCFQTVSALRQLIDSSAYPMAIVATIHQPDVEVFNLFHKCYVLASGGRAIYEGPAGGIFDTVRRGVDLVEARRKRPGRLAPLGGCSSDLLGGGDPLEGLRRQLELGPAADATSGGSVLLKNPARLIVEVAANEFGFEITSAMNEIQLAQHAPAAGDSSGSPDFAALPGGSSASSAVLLHQHSGGGTGSESLAAPQFDYQANEPASRRAHLDKLLSSTGGWRTGLADGGHLSACRVYLRHLGLHTSRSWLTIVRDPMLFSLQLLLHIMVPLMISYAFGFGANKSDACPRVGPLDVVEEAYRAGNVLDELNWEIRLAFENMGYMFFQIYVIIFAAVCVTSLTYPLAMHVLLKEYRNGWYSMSSYFLGRTLADLPVPSFNVVLAMGISYHLTGQASSPYAWRFLAVASLTVLATLVAQTQGLMFGAMLMNLPQSAVFVAPASTAPLVVVSGFLLRIKSLPWVLQLLSQFSYFTHLLNGFIVARYGFNRCPCDESDFRMPASHSIPAQTRGIMDIWVESFAPDYLPEYNATSSADSRPDPIQIDLVGKLVDTITRAKTFGHQIEDCSQTKPFTMLDYELNDTDLYTCFAALIAMLFVFRWLTFMTLSWKINSCI